MKTLSVVLLFVLFLTIGLSAVEEKADDVKVFPVCYRIATGGVGGVSLTVNLLVDLEDRHIKGYGKIFQPINPPLNLKLDLKGDFIILVNGPNTNFICHITGIGPDRNKYLPLEVERLHLFLTLSKDWQSGTASYRYQDNNGKWQVLNNIPVRAVPCGTGK